MVSSPRRTGPVLGAVGLATALIAVSACTTSETRGPPGATGPGAWPSGTAGHAYQASTDPLSPTPGSTATGSAAPLPNLAEPRRVAIAAASAVCNFDWQQKLTDRVAAVRRYATAAYAETLQPSASDAANWQRTQQDRESGSCSQATASVVSTAPNSATVYFERVRMQQQLRLPGKPISLQTFEVMYRVEKQYDGHWLVGAEGDGG